MRTIQIEIPGPPVGKGRPRFTRMGHTYTPKKTKEYESRVNTAFVMSGKASFKAGTRLIITVFAYMPIPSTISKKARKKLNGEPHSKKPDLDNIVKAIFDGLNGIAFEDDAKIWMFSARKEYSENPRTVVIITGEEDEN